jgi:hypothetical protein
MIEKISSNSKNSEVDITTQSMLDVINEKDWSLDTFFTEQIRILSDLNIRHSTAILRNKMESEMQARDDKRDLPIRRFNLLIEGYKAHPDPAIREAAEEVSKIFDNYGVGIIKDSYIDTSSAVVSMLRDFKNSIMQSHIAKLDGVAAILDELEATQNEFQTYFITYEKYRTEEGKKENATTIKLQVLKLINESIVTYLRAMEMAKPDEYGETCEFIGTIIADNNDRVRRRLNGQKDEDDDISAN